MAEVRRARLKEIEFIDKKEVWRKKDIVKMHEILAAEMTTPLEDVGVISGILCARLTLTAKF